MNADRRRALAALALGLAACVTPPPTVTTAPRAGDLVLVGGGAKPTAAIQRFVALAGGQAARIVGDRKRVV